MMTTREMQDEILRLKKEKDVCILVHAYESHDIWEVADYVGDSYGLSLQAADAPQKNVIMCGVRFMAETCKMLCPDKRVYMPCGLAGCPMADQYGAKEIAALKEQYPGYTTVAYINTTSETKTECDVCVTSSSAMKIVQNMDADKILFVPDPNLGSWVKDKCPDKEFAFVEGGCPVHMQMTKEDVAAAKAAHPDALLLVHPECKAEVTELADYAGSTTGIMKYAKESSARDFIIGTETSIVQHLQFECPDKNFYPLSKDCICHNMKITTLADVYRTLLGTAGEEILMTDELIAAAKKPIDKMIELGG